VAEAVGASDAETAAEAGADEVPPLPAGVLPQAANSAATVKRAAPCLVKETNVLFMDEFPLSDFVVSLLYHEMPICLRGSNFLFFAGINELPLANNTARCITTSGGAMMKLGAFLVGGVLGAAAVVMWNRSGRSLRFAGFSSLADTLGSIATDKMAHREESKQGEQQCAPLSETEAKSASLDEEVHKFASRDPQLQQQIDDILAEGAEVSPIKQ